MRWICVYARNNVKIEETICLKDHPCIVVQLAQTTIAFAYNPYCKNSKRLTEKESCINGIDILDQILLVAKRGLIIQGDFNVDYLSDTISNRRIENWALDSDSVQCMAAPTRVSTYVYA